MKDLSSEWPGGGFPAAEYRCALKIVEYIPRLLDRSGGQQKDFQKAAKRDEAISGECFPKQKSRKNFQDPLFCGHYGIYSDVVYWKIIHRIKQAVGKEGI